MKKIFSNLIWVLLLQPIILIGGAASVYEWERLGEAKCQLGLHKWNMFSNQTLCTRPNCIKGFL